MKRFQGGLPNGEGGFRPSLTGWLYGLFMGATLLICLFAMRRVPFFRTEFSRVFLSPWLLLVLGLGFLFLLLKLSERIAPRIRHGRAALLIASLCLFVF